MNTIFDVYLQKIRSELAIKVAELFYRIQDLSDGKDRSTKFYKIFIAKPRSSMRKISEEEIISRRDLYRIKARYNRTIEICCKMLDETDFYGIMGALIKDKIY